MRVPKKRALTAYKYLSEQVIDGELSYYSPTRYDEWTDFQMSGYVRFWTSAIKGGIYCYTESTATYYVSPVSRQVKLKIWGKIHEHHEEFAAPAGYRASHAEIEAVNVEGIWIPIHEYVAVIKEEHPLRLLKNEAKIRMDQELRNLIASKEQHANDRARAIALPPSPLPKEEARGEEHANDVTVANSPG